MTIQERIRELVAPGYAELQADLDRANAETRIYRDSLATFGDVLAENIVSVASPATMIANLKEQGFDSGMLDLLIDQIGWETITSLSAGGDDDSGERTNAVRQAIRLFRYSPLAQWSIWLWTGWGLGDKITVTLENPDAKEVWKEFAEAERNEPVLSEDVKHELSDWLLVKGNRVLVFFTTTTGTGAGLSTMRVLDQAQVKPVANPTDKLDTWFYRRTFSNGEMKDKVLYYPDHRTLLGDGGLLNKRWKILIKAGKVAKDAKRADLVKNAVPTTVSILHIAHNRKEERSPWGWPITTAAAPWIKGHKQFSEARLGVAMSMAQYTRRSRVKGGSRAVQSVISSIASTASQFDWRDRNPPGAAGSWAVENEAVNTKELPMRTGASDAKNDNELFSWMASLGMGLFPTSMGLDTSRWATAVEMDKAQAMLFERYQRFWGAQFQKIVRLVLMLESKYGPVSFTAEDTEAEISTDTFSLSDYPDVSKAVADQVSKMLTPYVDNGIIPADTAKGLLAKLWSLSLDALGSGVGRDLTTPEAFGVGEENETQPDATPAPNGDETEPGMESDFTRTLDLALQNLSAGDITPDQFAEFMVAEIGEVYGENGSS